jgi:carbonic anhydrase
MTVLIALPNSSYFLYDLTDNSVLAQVNSAKRIPTVQEAMKRRGLQVHGWIYDVSNGRLKAMETGEDLSHTHYDVTDSNTH